MGLFLSAIGLALIVGVFRGKLRLVDAAGIHLTKTCQFLLGTCLSYAGVGAAAKSLGRNIVNFRVLMTLIGSLIIVALFVEIRRVVDAIRHDRR